MKFSSSTLALLTVGLLVCGVGFLGCQKSTDSGNYQEYSELSPEKKQEKGEADAPATAAANAVKPAVAEKPDRPAIAQASYERAANGEAQTVSTTIPNSPDVPAKVEAVASADDAPREIKLLIPEKTFKKASADGTLRVSYDDIDLLKILNMQPVPADATDYFPGWLEQLDGKKIRIRGFMYPAFQATGLRGFVLARDNEICCFGRDPKVYDLIEVRMKDGTTTNYIPNRPFDVVGTFHIRPEADEDLLFRLYEIRDAEVILGR